MMKRQGTLHENRKKKEEEESYTNVTPPVYTSPDAYSIFPTDPPPL